MKRTTLHLPEELRLRAKELAKRRGMALADLVRRALEREVAESEGTADPAFATTRVVRGTGRRNASEDHDAADPNRSYS